MIKQLNKLNKHKLLSTGLLSPPSILLNVSERGSKRKHKKYVKSVKKNLLTNELIKHQNYMMI